MENTYNKDNLLNEINRIRREIGHEEVRISIKEIIHNKETKELWIIASDRPDKSAIIGKGGWVVGRLREDLKLSSIHVESYSDYISKEYKMKLSLNRINEVINKFENENYEFNDTLLALNNLKVILEDKITNLYMFNFKDYLKNKDFKESSTHQAVLALSGGSDSSFSLILAKKLGFNPIAISIDPGTIVLPKQFRENIDNLCDKLNVEHEYISVDYSNILKDAFSGRVHPCGRCSKVIEEEILKYAKENDIPFVIFGDMLATGSQCISNQTYTDENEKQHQIKRINLPATLSVGKIENKTLNKDYPLKEIKGFGCPLLHEVHKNFPHMKRYSIQRVLRETRSGALEPGQALDLIWSFYKV